MSASTRCENGSRLSAKSWLPSTTSTAPSRREAARARASRAARDEVAGDADEVGRRSRHPVDRVDHGATPARRHPEVEVGEVRDPQAVELGGTALERDLDHPRAQPARLEPRPRPRSPSRRRASRDGRSQVRPRASRSPASTETTWRLNFSSDASSPGGDADRAARGAGSASGSPCRSASAASTATRRARGGRAGTASPSRRRPPPSPARSAG